MAKKSLILSLILSILALLPHQAQAIPICADYCTDLSRCDDECLDTSLEIPSWRLCRDTQYLNCDPSWLAAAAPQDVCEAVPTALGAAVGAELSSLP